MSESQTKQSTKVKLTRCPRCGHRNKLASSHCSYCDHQLDSHAEDSTKAVGGLFTELFVGASYFPRGFAFLFSRPRLWPAAAVPTILSIICLIVSLVVAYELKGYFTSDLEAKIANWHAVFRYSMQTLIYIAQFLQILILPILTIWLFSIFGRIVYMPVMEILSEQTEKAVLGEVLKEDFSWGEFFYDLVMSLLNAVGLVIVQITCLFLLLPINFIPGLGSMIWFVLPGVVFASMDFTDLNFVRRKYGLNDRLNIWWQRRYRFFGFGLAFFMFLSVPVLNILTATFVIPIACVGGTLLFLELDVK